MTDTDVRRGTIHAVWLSLVDGLPGRCCWDDELLAEALDGTLWPNGPRPAFAQHDSLDGVPAGEGAVVIVPARYHADDAGVAGLNGALARLAWCVVVLASDEESTFPWRRLKHPRMRLWVMTPRPGEHPPVGTEPGGPVRYIGEGWQPGTQRLLDGLEPFPDVDRPLHAFFAGQVTHERRRRMAQALGGDERRQIIQTDHFAAGVEQLDYLAGLASAKLAPAPAGPATPDSFRLYEALEAGCLPIADAGCDAYGHGGYWELLCGGRPPWPIVLDWGRADARIPGWLARWPYHAARSGAWWQAHKRSIAYGLADDAAALGGPEQTLAAAGPLAGLVTVVVTASPIPSHPSTGVIEQTVDSVYRHAELAGCELIVTCDAPRPGQEHRADAYHEHLRRLVALCRRRWRALPLIADGWEHQANRLRAALDQVRTPLVLVVEHDTPLVDWCGPTDWHGMAGLLMAGDANLVRLLHEADVLDDHRHLMVDAEPVALGPAGVPVIRTVQWSQRPHLALTGWYRRLLAAHFGRESRTFVEDSLHGTVQNAWRDLGEGVDGWERSGYRLAVYAPDTPSRMRSTHLDGRGGDPKAPCKFAYDGSVPTGAPNEQRDE